MVVAIADTHAALWYLYNDARLSPTARTFMETAAQQGNQIGISAITFAEMVYLIEKGKIFVESLTGLAALIDDPHSMFVEVPLNLQIARLLARVDRAHVPDFPDRIIVATALYTGGPVITRDAAIQTSSVQTIW